MTQGSDHIINMNELMKRLYPSFINMKGTQEYNNIKVELVHNKKPSQLSINLGPHVKCFNSNRHVKLQGMNYQQIWVPR